LICGGRLKNPGSISAAFKVHAVFTESVGASNQGEANSDLTFVFVESIALNV
jgi:hypothetical protein